MLDKYAETIALKSRVEQGSQGGFVDNPREVGKEILALIVPGWMIWKTCTHPVGDEKCFKCKHYLTESVIDSKPYCEKTGRRKVPATQQEVNNGKAVRE